MTTQKLLKILRKDGWMVKNIRGSHIQMVHPIKVGKITIPKHSGDLKKGTLNSILKQAKIKEIL